MMMKDRIVLKKVKGECEDCFFIELKGYSKMCDGCDNGCRYVEDIISENETSEWLMKCIQNNTDVIKKIVKALEIIVSKNSNYKPEEA